MKHFSATTQLVKRCGFSFSVRTGVNVRRWQTKEQL